jgi:hypothetical protein
MKRVIGATVWLAFLFGICVAEGPMEMQTYRGICTNADYGFSVEIPDGLTGRGAGLHAPNHGSVVTLHPKSSVWVDASYDVDDSPHFFRRYNARLGVLRAERKAWTKSGGQFPSVCEEIVARGFDRGTPIIYQIGVDTVPEYRDEAFRLFESLVNSFQTVPVRR